MSLQARFRSGLWLLRGLAALANAAVGVVAMIVGISTCLHFDGSWSRPDPLLLGVAIVIALGTQVATFAVFAPPCRIRLVTAILSVPAVLLVAAVGSLPLWRPEASPWASVTEHVPLLLLGTAGLDAATLLASGAFRRRPARPK